MRVEPRVAFFPDSFVEVNGVAHTSRQLAAFAERRDLPLLCVHGAEGAGRVMTGSVTKLSLGRGNFGFKLDADFRYDLLFWRHANRAIEAAREFKANVVHITGPNHTGQLGAYVAQAETAVGNLVAYECARICGATIEQIDGGAAEGLARLTRACG